MSAEAGRRTAHLKQEVFDVEHSVFTVDVFHYAFLFFVLLVSADELEPHCVMSTLGRKEKNGVLGDDVFYVRHAVSEDCSHCFKSRSKWTSGALTLPADSLWKW